MARWLLVAIPLAIGCSVEQEDTQPAPVPYFRSGSRLRARVFASDGGARVFRGFHDTSLDMACTPMRAPDGNYRCAPPLGRVAYADSTCTRPVVVRDSGCAPPARFVSGEVSLVCHERVVEVYETGAKVGSGSFYLQQWDGCRQSGMGDHYAASKLPSDRLVAFVEGSSSAGRVATSTLPKLQASTRSQPPLRPE